MYISFLISSFLLVIRKKSYNGYWNCNTRDY